MANSHARRFVGVHYCRHVFMHSPEYHTMIVVKLLEFKES